MSHQEFPKWMAHPHAQKSVPVKTEPGAPDKGLFSSGYQGTVEKFPPVTVNNEDEEAEYVSKGYAEAGKSNPWAFNDAQATPTPPGYEPVQYPKWVNGTLVNNVAEEAALNPAPVVVAEVVGMADEAVPVPVKKRPGRKPKVQTDGAAGVA